MKLTVAQRIYLMVGVVLIGILALTGALLYQMERVYESANYGNANTAGSLDTLDDLRQGFLEVKIKIRDHILNIDDSKMDAVEVEINKYRQQVVDDIQHFQTDGCQKQSCVSDDKDQAYLNQIKATWAAYDAKLPLILKESRKGMAGIASARALLEDPQFQALSDKIAQTIEDEFNYNVSLGQKGSAEAVVVKHDAFVLSMLISACLLALVGALGYLTRLAILRQIGGEPSVAVEVVKRIAAGDLHTRGELTAASRNSLLGHIKAVADNLEELALASDAIGGGDFSQDIKVASEHDRLGNAIKGMSAQLFHNQEEEKRRHWVNTGQSQLSNALTGDYSSQQICDAAISLLGRYLEAGRGVVYTYDPESESLDLMGSYMYTERANVGSRFKLGEGAVGQVAREKKPIILTTVSSDAALVVTGTSSHVPLYTYTYPLLRENELLGVLELAGFARLDATSQEFLRTAAEVIASFMYVAQQRENVRKLLAMAEAAEKDARLQSEHLQEANARMEEQQQLLQQQSEELRQSNAQMEEQQQQLEQNNETLRRSQAELDARAKQLETAGQYKSEFLANMSHELRTPLNAIILLSKLMAGNREGRLVEEDVERVNVIHRSGRDLLALINDVLDLSKIEAGRMDLNVSTIASSTIVGQTKDLFAAQVQEKGLTLTVTDQIRGSFSSDPDKLNQILRNLLSNALKFTKHGGITLTLQKHPDRALPISISVRDSGIGIPKEKQALIFEAFRQADGSTMREYGGTGLGLTISLRLAQLLGGTIELVSTSGEGSSFTLLLPERPPGASPVSTEVVVAGHPREGQGTFNGVRTGGAVPEDDRNSIQTGDRVILLIDDDQHFGRIVVDLNHGLGYKTLVATTGAEGLALARQWKPSGILLDLGLPDQDGTDVLSQLKSHSDLAALPVYIVSARDHDDAVEMKAVVGYLTKPVDAEQIASAEVRLLSVLRRQDAHAIMVIGDVENGGVSAAAVSQLLSEGDAAASQTVVNVSGMDGLPAALARRHWNLAIIDMKSMPFGTTLEIAQTLRNADPQISILFYGAHAVSETEEAQLGGFSDCVIIQAPQASQRLLANMQRFLQTSVQVRAQAPLADARNNKTSVQDKRLSGHRILVVDDDPRNLFVVTAALEQYGASVSTAVNGRKALDLLHAQDFDMVFMDIMMPEMDGFQTIAAMRAAPKLKGVPVVALTAKAMPQDRAKVLEAGASDYLSKPVEYDDLVACAVRWCTA